MTYVSDVGRACDGEAEMKIITLQELVDTISNVDVGVAEMKIMRSSCLEESARECGRAHQSERCARRGENLGW